MLVPKKTIFGIPVTSLTLQDLLKIIAIYIQKNGKKTFFYINAHCINLSLKDPHYKNILQKADLVYSGGIGPIWASVILGKPLEQRSPTPDFIDQIFSLAEKNRWTVYLLGSADATVKKTAVIISKAYPHIIVGYHSGYFSLNEEKELIKDINSKKPTILLVGMGPPKQEEWIDIHKKDLDVSAFWAVGALFDVISGRIQRAPKWMQRLGLEWLYRLIKEPKRLWKRYIFGNMLFLKNTIRELYV